MDFLKEIRDAERRYKLIPGVLEKLIEVESSGNVNAISPKGAIGLTQLMAGTASEMGLDPYDPMQNIEGGARYLRQGLDKFNDNYTQALAGYNAGFNNKAVKSMDYDSLPSETKTYIDKLSAFTTGANTNMNNTNTNQANTNQKEEPIVLKWDEPEEVLKWDEPEKVVNPVIPKETVNPVIPKETGMGNYIENMIRGLSGGFEQQAAGLADTFGLAPQQWLDKVKAQQRWINQRKSAGVGKIGADAITGTALTLALPELRAAGTIMKPLAQIGQDILTGGFLGTYLNPGSINDRYRSGTIDALGSGLFSTGGQLLKLGGQAGVAGYRAVHDLFSESGRMSKLAEYVKQAVEKNDIPSVVSMLRADKSLVPGTNPTAAEKGNNYGLNTLQNYAYGIKPGQYIDRELANIRAESDLMAAVVDYEKLPNAIANRTAITNPLYEAAKRAMVPVNNGLVQLFKTPEMRKALNKAIITGSNNRITPPTRAMLNQILSGKNGAAISGDALHHIKLGLDELIKIAKNPREGLDQKAFKNLRGEFENWRETNMPEYAQAQAAYRKTSKPVNRRNAGQDIVNQVYPHGVEDPAALYKTDPFKLGDILRDPDELVKRGTDFAGATYDKVFTKRQRQLMANVSESQRRRLQSKLISGSGFQHDGSGNMAARGAGAVAQAGTNIPGAYQIGSASMISKLTGQNRKLQELLADTLLDPIKTADLFDILERDSAFKSLSNSTLNKIPGIFGQSLSNRYNDKVRRKK